MDVKRGECRRLLTETSMIHPYSMIYPYWHQQNVYYSPIFVSLERKTRSPSCPLSPKCFLSTAHNYINTFFAWTELPNPASPIRLIGSTLLARGAGKVSKDRSRSRILCPAAPAARTQTVNLFLVSGLPEFCHPGARTAAHILFGSSCVPGLATSRDRKKKKTGKKGHWQNFLSLLVKFLPIFELVSNSCCTKSSALSLGS